MTKSRVGALNEVRIVKDLNEKYRESLVAGRFHEDRWSIKEEEGILFVHSFTPSVVSRSFTLNVCVSFAKILRFEKRRRAKKNRSNFFRSHCAPM